MSLLTRLAKIIARIALFLVVGLIRWLFQRVAFPSIRFAFRSALFLIMIAFTASINGPGQFIDRLASDWTRRLLAIGISRDHLDISHRISRVIIVGMIVMGWVLIVAGTVLIVATIRWIVT